MENWKPVVGFEGLYEVSDLGNVKSLSRMVRSKAGSMRHVRERAMRTCLAPTARYVSLILRKEGKSYFKHVHRLVAQAHIPNPENKPQVNHKNASQKWNNTVANLEWATRAEDDAHVVANGLKPRGHHHYFAKLNAKKVQEMRRLDKQGWSTRSLADKFSLSTAHVRLVIRGLAWGHVSSDILPSEDAHG